VATNSRLSHRETDPELAALNPSRSSSGLKIPPSTMAPVSGKKNDYTDLDIITYIMLSIKIRDFVSQNT
jgi:hypothetical protein